MNTAVIIGIVLVLVVIVGVAAWMMMGKKDEPAPVIAPLPSVSGPITPVAPVAPVETGLQNKVVYGELWTGPNFTGKGYEIVDPAYRTFESLGIAPGSIKSVRAKAKDFDIGLYVPEGYVIGTIKGKAVPDIGEWSSSIVGVGVTYSKW